ncbi:hypothetical protein ACVDFE_31370 [Lentzea chajnantorensis]
MTVPSCVSPVLHGGREAWEGLRTVLSTVRRQTDADGDTPDASAMGGHVNVSLPGGLTAEQAVRLAQLAKANEEVLFWLGNRVEADGQDRRIDLLGPNPVPPHSVDEYADGMRAESHDQRVVWSLNANRNEAVNFEHLGEPDEALRRVEFRFWTGSLDPATWQVQSEISAAMYRAATDASTHDRIAAMMREPLLLAPGGRVEDREFWLDRLLSFAELLPLSPVAQQELVKRAAMSGPWHFSPEVDATLRSQEVGRKDAIVFPAPETELRQVLALLDRLPRRRDDLLLSVSLTPDGRHVRLWNGQTRSVADFAAAAEERGIGERQSVDWQGGTPAGRVVLLTSGGTELAQHLANRIGAPVLATTGDVRFDSAGDLVAVGENGPVEWVEFTLANEPSGTGTDRLEAALRVAEGSEDDDALPATSFVPMPPKPFTGDVVADAVHGREAEPDLSGAREDAASLLPDPAVEDIPLVTLVRSEADGAAVEDGAPSAEESSTAGGLDLPGDRSSGLVTQRGEIAGGAAVDAAIDALLPEGERKGVEHFVTALKTGVGGFLGDGRSEDVEIGGKHYELHARTRYLWDGATESGTASRSVGLDGPTGSATLSAASSAAQANSALALVLIPATPGFTAVGTVGASTDASNSVAVGASATASGGRQVAVAFPTRDVSVPVWIELTLRDARGRVVGDPVEVGDVVADLSVPDVPGGEPGGVLADGPAFVESVHIGRNAPGSYRGRPLPPDADGEHRLFDKVVSALPGSLVKPGRPGRSNLREFLDDSTFKKRYQDMAVTAEQAERGHGWVRSEMLFTGKHPFVAWLHTPSAVEMRLVEREEPVVLRTLDDVTFTDVESIGAEVSDSGTASHGANSKMMAGPGFDLGVAGLVAGPVVMGGVESAHKQSISRSGEVKHTSTRRGRAQQVERVFDLQVRVPGKPAMTFAGDVRAVEWREVTAEVAPETDAVPPRRLYGPEALESGRALAGASLEVSQVASQVLGLIENSIRTVPGHKRWYLSSDRFLSQFDDPSAGRTIGRKLQEALGRRDALRRLLTDRELGLLADRALSADGLRIPVQPKHGWGHDYHVSFTLKASMSDLRDTGEVRTAADPAVVTTSDTQATQHTKSRTKSTGIGAAGRVTATITERAVVVVASLYSAFAWTRSGLSGVTAKRGEERREGGALDDTGAVVAEPKHRFTATVDWTLSGQTYKRHNAMVRGLSIGRPGLHVPRTEPVTLVDPESGATSEETTFRVEADVWVPEAHVSRMRPDPVVVERTAGRQDQPHVRLRPEPDAPVSADPLRRGLSRDLDGIRVLSFEGLAHVRAAVKDALTRASGDPAFSFAESDNSVLVDTVLSPDSVMADQRVFSRTTGVRGLQWARRRVKRFAAAEVSFQPRDVEVLGEGWRQAVTSAAVETGVGAGKEFTAAVTAAADLTAFAFYKDVTTDGKEGATVKPGALLVIEGDPMVLEKSSTEDVATDVATGTSTARQPERLHLVRFGVRTTVVAEVRSRRWRNAWGVLRPAAPATANEQFDLPRAVTAWVTTAQLDAIRTKQAEEDARVRDLATRSDPATSALAALAVTTLAGTAPAAPSAVADAFADDPAAAVDDETGETAGDRVVAPPAFLRPGEPLSVGLGVVDGVVDLRSVLPELRRDLERSLGPKRARRLIPLSPLSTGHDNYAAISSWLSDAQTTLEDSARGGVPQPLRLEDRTTGETYDVVMTNELLDRPVFAGLEHGGVKQTRGTTTLGSRVRTFTRTLLRLEPVVLPALQAGGPAPDENVSRSNPYAMMGGGVIGDVLLGRKKKTTKKTHKVVRESSAETSGTFARFHVPVEFTVAIERHGRRVAEAGAAHDVSILHLPEDTVPARPAAVVAPVVQPEEEAEPDALTRWRGDTGLGRGWAGHLRFDVGDLVAAAELAHREGTGLREVPADVRSALRTTLTGPRFKALLPLHATTGTPLEIPLGGGRSLELHARRTGTPTLTGVSARTTVSTQGNSSGTETVAEESAAEFGMAAGPLLGPGGTQPPGHEKFGEQKTLGGGAAFAVPLRVVGGTGSEGEAEAEHHHDGESVPASSSTGLAGLWLNDIEVRFVARTQGRTGHRDRVAVVDFGVRDAVVLVDDDHQDRIPAELADTARTLAAADATLVAAASALAGALDAAQRDVEGSAEALARAENAHADALDAWWDALHAHEAQVGTLTEPADEHLLPPLDLGPRDTPAELRDLLDDTMETPVAVDESGARVPAPRPSPNPTAEIRLSPAAPRLTPADRVRVGRVLGRAGELSATGLEIVAHGDLTGPAPAAAVSAVMAEITRSARRGAGSAPRPPVQVEMRHVAEAGDVRVELRAVLPADDAPPVRDDVPPSPEEMRPAPVELPPLSVELPPVSEEVPSVSDDVSSLSSEDVLPVPDDVSSLSSTDLSPVSGDVSSLSDDATPVSGDVSPLSDDATPVSGDVSPMSDDAPPVPVEVPPVSEDVPPVPDDAPPVSHEDGSTPPPRPLDAPADDAAPAAPAADTDPAGDTPSTVDPEPKPEVDSTATVRDGVSTRADSAVPPEEAVVEVSGEPIGTESDTPSFAGLDDLDAARSGSPRTVPAGPEQRPEWTDPRQPAPVWWQKMPAHALSAFHDQARRIVERHSVPPMSLGEPSAQQVEQRNKHELAVEVVAHHLYTTDQGVSAVPALSPDDLVRTLAKDLGLTSPRGPRGGAPGDQDLPVRPGASSSNEQDSAPRRLSDEEVENLIRLRRAAHPHEGKGQTIDAVRLQGARRSRARFTELYNKTTVDIPRPERTWEDPQIEELIRKHLPGHSTIEGVRDALRAEGVHVGNKRFLNLYHKVTDTDARPYQVGEDEEKIEFMRRQILLGKNMKDTINAARDTGMTGGRKKWRDLFHLAEGRAVQDFRRARQESGTAGEQGAGSKRPAASVEGAVTSQHKRSKPSVAGAVANELVGLSLEENSPAATAAALGLRVVDVAPDGDHFYAAVLASVPESVWSDRLDELGVEASVAGLRQATADAYRRVKLPELGGRSLEGMRLPADAVEDGLRTSGQWDGESVAVAAQLVPGVLKINLKTITHDGRLSTNGVAIDDSLDTYYVVHDGVKHYQATASDVPAQERPDDERDLELIRERIAIRPDDDDGAILAMVRAWGATGSDDRLRELIGEVREERLQRLMGVVRQGTTGSKRPASDAGVQSPQHKRTRSSVAGPDTGHRRATAGLDADQDDSARAQVSDADRLRANEFADRELPVRSGPASSLTEPAPVLPGAEDSSHGKNPPSQGTLSRPHRGLSDEQVIAAAREHLAENPDAGIMLLVEAVRQRGATGGDELLRHLVHKARGTEPQSSGGSSEEEIESLIREHLAENPDAGVVEVRDAIRLRGAIGGDGKLRNLIHLVRGTQARPYGQLSEDQISELIRKHLDKNPGERVKGIIEAVRRQGATGADEYLSSLVHEARGTQAEARNKSNDSQAIELIREYFAETPDAGVWTTVKAVRSRGASGGDKRLGDLVRQVVDERNTGLIREHIADHPRDNAKAIVEAVTARGAVGTEDRLRLLVSQVTGLQDGSEEEQVKDLIREHIADHPRDNVRAIAKAVRQRGGTGGTNKMMKLIKAVRDERTTPRATGEHGIAAGAVEGGLGAPSSEEHGPSAQSAAAAARLGLRVVDVERDGDCFYEAVLRSVPQYVWSDRLTQLGRQATVLGLRQATADAYRGLRRLELGWQSPDDLGLPADAIEIGLRTRGHWASESGDFAPQLVPGVLKINLKTITNDGGLSTNGVDIDPGLRTYYVVHDGINHYRATAPLDAAQDALIHAPVGEPGPSRAEPLATAGTEDRSHDETQPAPATRAPAQEKSADERDVDLIREHVARHPDDGDAAVVTTVRGWGATGSDDHLHRLVGEVRNERLQRLTHFARHGSDEPGTVEEQRAAERVIHQHLVENPLDDTESTARAVREQGVLLGSTWLTRLIDDTRLSIAVDGLGLRIVDVAAGRDSFYEAVLRSVPRGVWSAELDRFGQEGPVAALRQATADAYRRQRSHEPGEQRPDELEADRVEEGLRTSEHQNAHSGYWAPQLVADVLGVNLKTIRKSGWVSTHVGFDDELPTYYVVHRDDDRYQATEHKDLPTAVRERVIAFVPPDRGWNTLLDALEHVQTHEYPALDLTRNAGGVPADPATQELVGRWVVAMLGSRRAFTLAEVAELSGGLVTADVAERIHRASGGTAPVTPAVPVTSAVPAPSAAPVAAEPPSDDQIKAWIKEYRDGDPGSGVHAVADAVARRGGVPNGNHLRALIYEVMASSVRRRQFRDDQIKDFIRRHLDEYPQDTNTMIKLAARAHGVAVQASRLSDLTWEVRRSAVAAALGLRIVRVASGNDAFFEAVLASVPEDVWWTRFWQVRREASVRGLRHATADAYRRLRSSELDEQHPDALEVDQLEIDLRTPGRWDARIDDLAPLLMVDVLNINLKTIRREGKLSTSDAFSDDRDTHYIVHDSGVSYQATVPDPSAQAPIGGPGPLVTAAESSAGVRGSSHDENRPVSGTQAPAQENSDDARDGELVRRHLAEHPGDDFAAIFKAVGPHATGSEGKLRLLLFQLTGEQDGSAWSPSQIKDVLKDYHEAHPKVSVTNAVDAVLAQGVAASHARVAALLRDVMGTPVRHRNKFTRTHVLGLIRKHLEQHPGADQVSTAAAVRKQGVSLDNEELLRLLRLVQQSIAAAELGLDVVEVTTGPHAFYEAVLRSVPEDVWSRRLGQLGREATALGLRQATADAYRNMPLPHLESRSLNELGLPADEVEQGVRNPGPRDVRNSHWVSTLMPAVLGVNVKTMTLKRGRLAAEDVLINDELPTFYVVRDGSGHYRATIRLEAAPRNDEATGSGSRSAPDAPAPAQENAGSRDHGVRTDDQIKDLIKEYYGGHPGSAVREIVNAVSGQVSEVDPDRLRALVYEVVAASVPVKNLDDERIGELIRVHLAEYPDDTDKVIVLALRVSGVDTRKARLADLIHRVQQSVAAAGFGLGVVEVAPGPDSFYEAVLRSVPEDVWSRRLTQLGREATALGLRHAMADAYRRIWLPAGEVEEGLLVLERSPVPGHDLVPRLIAEVLGVDVKTIRKNGRLATTLALGRILPTYYVVHVRADHYRATAPLDVVQGGSVHAPDLPRVTVIDDGTSAVHTPPEPSGPAPSHAEPPPAVESGSHDGNRPAPETQPSRQQAPRQQAPGEARVENAEQSVAAAGLGLRIVDVTTGPDSFYEAVLRSVPGAVLSDRLGRLGQEPSVTGLRNATADTYRRMKLPERGGRSRDELGLPADEVETGLRTPGRSNRQSAFLAPQLVMEVLGRNLRAIREDGRLSTHSAFGEDVPTHYVVFDGDDNYRATELVEMPAAVREQLIGFVPPAYGLGTLLDALKDVKAKVFPALGLEKDPSGVLTDPATRELVDRWASTMLKHRSGFTPAQIAELSGGLIVVRQDERVHDVPDDTPADVTAGPVESAVPMGTDMPAVVRERVIAFVPPAYGLGTLLDALKDVKANAHPALDLTRDSSGIPTDPTTRELVGQWASTMLKHRSGFTPAQVAELSGGLVTEALAEHVHTLSHETPSEVAPTAPAAPAAPVRADLPDEVRDRIVTLVPPAHGLATLLEALEHVQANVHPALDLTRNSGGAPVDPVTRGVVGQWVLAMLEHPSGFTPARVAELSGGLIAAHEVAHLYNISHDAQPEVEGGSWMDQGRREQTFAAEKDAELQDVYASRAITHGLQPIMGMDDQFYWRSLNNPLFEVAELFAGPDGNIHPDIRARADEITVRVVEGKRGKGEIEGIANDSRDSRLPRMRPQQLRAMWKELEYNLTERVRHVVATAVNPTPDTVTIAPLRPQHANSSVYVSRVAPRHVGPREKVLVGQYQLLLANTPGSVQAEQQPLLTRGRFVDLYLGGMFDNTLDAQGQLEQEDRWREQHPAYPSYLMEGGTRDNPRLISAEGASNSTAFANSVLTPDGKIDRKRVNAVFVSVEVSIPDKNDPTGVIKVGGSAMLLLDNVINAEENPFGIVLVDYSEGYKFPKIKEEPQDQ